MRLLFPWVESPSLSHRLADVGSEARGIDSQTDKVPRIDGIDQEVPKRAFPGLLKV